MVLKIPGSIPAAGKETFGEEQAPLQMTLAQCAVFQIGMVTGRPLCRDSHPLCRLKNPTSVLVDSSCKTLE